jgi:signal transduction histidine kinase
MLVLRDVTGARRDADAKHDFISTASHELRSRLRSIKRSMGLLLSNAAGDSPRSARGLPEIAHRNAERLVMIINDILDLQKMLRMASRSRRRTSKWVH